MEKQNRQSGDRLRSRFTSWLTTLLYRARIDYLRHQERTVETVSLEEVPEACLAFEDQHDAPKSEFDFAEERLATAFFSLSVQRQRILTMLFVEERKPAEIADLLHCSEAHVAQQRFQALKKLRQLLDEEDHT